jgi:CheY-like chemotaxis protein
MNNINYQYDFILIDDSSIDMLFNESRLLQSGFVKSIRKYYSADEALQNIREANPIAQTIILLDIHMPQMSGLQFLEAYNLLELQDYTVVVCSSTRDSIELQILKGNKKVSGLLEKPLNISELAKLVHDITLKNSK